MPGFNIGIWYKVPLLKLQACWWLLEGGWDLDGVGGWHGNSHMHVLTVSSTMYPDVLQYTCTQLRKYKEYIAYFEPNQPSQNGEAT